MRPLKEVKLPVAGWVASVVTYFTLGEREQITEAALTSESKKKASKLSSSLSLTGALKMQRKNLELGIKKLQDKDGEEIKVTPKVIEDLPEDDAFGVLSSLPKRKKK